MNSNTKILYIIAGANGSGKSTLAEVLLKEKNLEFLNADEIAKEISPNAIDKVPITAGKEYFKRLLKFFDEGKSFAVETTLSGKNIARIISKAEQNGYKISLVYIYLNKFTTCIKRVKARVLNGGHKVPDEDITRRYYKSVVNFWYNYKNVVNDWTLFYNGEDYNPVCVADGNKQTCDIMKEEMYQNFLEIVKSAKEEVKIV